MKQRILAFDLESTPLISYTWGIWEQNVIEVQQDSHMLCYAYRWLDEKKTHIVALPDFKNYKKDKTDDSALVQSLWDLFDQADIILAHNGDRFDIKYSNARFLAHGLTPPSNYQTIDTLKIAKSRFKFNSNKLNSLGEMLKVGVKVETGGFALWLGCMAGEAKSWKLMKKYNIQDVDLLIAVYEKLKPWAKNHPVVNIEEDRAVCSRGCNGTVQKRGFEASRTGGKRQRWICMECGANMYSSIKGKFPLKSS